MTEGQLQNLERANAERRQRKNAALAGPWLMSDDGRLVLTVHGVTLVCSLERFQGHLPEASRPSALSTSIFIAYARNDNVEDHVDGLIAIVRQLQETLAEQDRLFNSAAVLENEARLLDRAEKAEAKVRGLKTLLEEQREMFNELCEAGQGDDDFQRLLRETFG